MKKKKRIVRIIDDTIGTSSWGYFTLPSPYTVDQVINVVPLDGDSPNGCVLNNAISFEWYTSISSNRIMTINRNGYTYAKAYVYLWVDD